MEDRGVVASLFDLSFTSFITPKIVKFLYMIQLVVAGIASLGVLVSAFGLGHGFVAKIGSLVIGVPLAGLCFILLTMYFRVITEILIVVFRGVEYLGEISESVKSRSA